MIQEHNNTPSVWQKRVRTAFHLMSGPEGSPHPCPAIVQLVVMGGELGGLGEGLSPLVHPGSGFNLRLWLFGPQSML